MLYRVGETVKPPHTQHEIPDAKKGQAMLLQRKKTPNPFPFKEPRSSCVSSMFIVAGLAGVLVATQGRGHKEWGAAGQKQPKDLVSSTRNGSSSTVVVLSTSISSFSTSTSTGFSSNHCYYSR